MLSNTMTPIYYGQFREKVLRREIPVNYWVSQEMNRIDQLIKIQSCDREKSRMEFFLAVLVFAVCKILDRLSEIALIQMLIIITSHINVPTHSF